MCKKFSYHGTTVPLSEEKIREFLMDSNQMAAKGLRSNGNNNKIREIMWVFFK